MLNNMINKKPYLKLKNFVNIQRSINSTKNSLLSYNRFNISLFTQNNIKSGFIYSKLFYLKRYHFCNLARLNFEKLKMGQVKAADKIDNIDNKIILDEKELQNREAEKKFVFEENIIEFDPSLNWEEVVLKAEVPVLVDCYAE